MRPVLYNAATKMRQRNYKKGKLHTNIPQDVNI